RNLSGTRFPELSVWSRGTAFAADRASPGVTGPATPLIGSRSAVGRLVAELAPPLGQWFAVSLV
ncbi:hypothetical protein J7S33_29025, partial [Saccharothrix algeriensis]